MRNRVADELPLFIRAVVPRKGRRMRVASVVSTVDQVIRKSLRSQPTRTNERRTRNVPKIPKNRC